MKESVFIFDSIQPFYYESRKIRHWKSYIVSPHYMKSKKGTINPENRDHKYFQYTSALGLNHEKIKWNRKRVLNIKLKHL